MIAVDTNILIHAHRRESRWFERASGRLRRLAESGEGWAIPWPCVHEFLSISTSPRIFDPPTPVETALEQVEIWSESPSLVFLGELGVHWRELFRIVRESGVVGPRIHDARIAALCRQHGVRLLWTADRDFSRFPWLQVENPLVGSEAVR